MAIQCSECGEEYPRVEETIESKGHVYRARLCRKCCLSVRTVELTFEEYMSIKDRDRSVENAIDALTIAGSWLFEGKSVIDRRTKERRKPSP